jgi:hypothetical protein
LAAFVSGVGGAVMFALGSDMIVPVGKVIGSLLDVAGVVSLVVCFGLLEADVRPQADRLLTVHFPRAPRARSLGSRQLMTLVKNAGSKNDGSGQNCNCGEDGDHDDLYAITSAVESGFRQAAGERSGCSARATMVVIFDLALGSTLAPEPRGRRLGG